MGMISLSRFRSQREYFALKRTDGMDGMGSTNVFNARFRQTEEAHLAFPHEIADGPGDILHRPGPVHAMLVEQIDAIEAEPEKRYVGDVGDVFWPTTA